MNLDEVKAYFTDRMLRKGYAPEMLTWNKRCVTVSRGTSRTSVEIVQNCGFAGLNAILSTFPNVSEAVNDAA